MTIDTQMRLSNAETSLRNRTTTPSGNPEELRKNDFMNLFMTQMSHQDPMDPMDSGAMMSQLAQLGSMEQLENMNGQLKEMNGTQKEISRFQALNFLDRDVMMETNKLELTKGSGRPVYYMLNDDTENLKLTIEELDGSPVFSEQLGMVTAGKHQFAWDGRSDEGIMMGDGNYNIKVMAKGRDGSYNPIDIYKAGRISQIEYRSGKPWVKINNQMMPLSSVSTVDNLSKRLFGGASPLPIRQDLEPSEISQNVKTEDAAE